MPALSEIGKNKRLAELFVLAINADSGTTTEKYKEAVLRLMDHDLTERRAVNFLEAAFKRLDRQGMIRSIDQILKDVCAYFLKQDHKFILAQIQAILEKGNISETSQGFFDLCSSFLYPQ